MLEGLDPSTIAAVAAGLGALIGALANWANGRRKTEADIHTEERRQIADRSTKFTEQIMADRDRALDLAAKEARRYDELMAATAERDAAQREHIARLEERLSSIDQTLQEISTASGDFIKRREP